MSKDAQEVIITSIVICLLVNSIIISFWYSFTHPIKTAEQIREETYQMCIDRQTWAARTLSNQINIQECELIKTNTSK